MSQQPKVEYSQLEKGYEFPLVSYALDPKMVSTYLKAVEETDSIYQGTGLVPPTAVAACAMAALSESLSFPPGSIHVSQEFEFKDVISIGDTVFCKAKVSRKQTRGKLNLLSVSLEVRDQEQKLVLSGETGFVLPE